MAGLCAGSVGPSVAHAGGNNGCLYSTWTRKFRHSGPLSAAHRTTRDRGPITRWSRALRSDVLADVIAAVRVKGRGHTHPLGVDTPAVVALILSKTADGVATLIGLTMSPRIVETNLYLRITIRHLGPLLGVTAATIVVLVLVIAVTESAVVAGLRLDPEAQWVVGVTRFVGYVPLSMVFVGVSLHNVTVIIQQLRI